MFNLVVQRTYLHTRLAVGRLKQGVPAVGARPLSLLVSGSGGQWKQAVAAGPVRRETSVMAEPAQQHHGQQRRSESVDAVDSEMMSEAYGAAYSTRSGDEGFGQIYTDTVKVHRLVHQQGDDSGLPESNHNPARAVHVVSLSKAGQEDLDNEFDEQPGSIPADFDTEQGSPVVQKEHGRHSLREDACDDCKAKAGTAGAST